MFYEQDWMMRQINMTVQFVARAVFHKDYIDFNIPTASTPAHADSIDQRLRDLLKERRINEAENLLFDQLRINDLGYLEIAVDFYQALNALSDEELLACDFSREEVRDGLHDIMERFGVPAIGLEDW